MQPHGARPSQLHRSRQALLGSCRFPNSETVCTTEKVAHSAAEVQDGTSFTICEPLSQLRQVKGLGCEKGKVPHFAGPSLTRQPIRLFRFLRRIGHLARAGRAGRRERFNGGEFDRQLFATEINILAVLLAFQAYLAGE